MINGCQWYLGEAILDHGNRKPAISSSFWCQTIIFYLRFTNQIDPNSVLCDIYTIFFTERFIISIPSHIGNWEHDPKQAGNQAGPLETGSLEGCGPCGSLYYYYCNCGPCLHASLRCFCTRCWKVIHPHYQGWIWHKLLVSERIGNQWKNWECTGKSSGQSPNTTKLKLQRFHRGAPNRQIGCLYLWSLSHMSMVESHDSSWMGF